VTLPRRWVLATSNPGKAAELEALMADAALELTLVAQSELGITPPPETGLSFVENALLKARHAARATGLPAIADDSGLVVAALGGAPGVRSARFAGDDADDAANVAKLLEALRDVPPDSRGASFHCVLVALSHTEDPAPVIATGEWRGTIARSPIGDGGFGYDPVFFDSRLGKTAAELSAAAKNRWSHRGAALRRLVKSLQNR
jgi:XTP/dITP diphosphohydrolase